MTDAGQRGVEVDQVAAYVMHAAGQTVGGGEHTADDALMEHRVGGYLARTLLVARAHLLEMVLHGVAAVAGHHTVEREAR